MRRNLLYGIWAWMWILCALLGHITAPRGSQAVALLLIGVSSFIPGILLLVNGVRTGHAKTVRTVRWISGLSLGLTAAAFIANILSVKGSDALGLVCHEILIFVSSPMMCVQVYPLSMFIWACLFVSTFRGKKQ